MKIKLIRMAAIAVVAISMGACSLFQSSGENEGTNEGTMDISKASYEKAYQAAEASYNKVKEANNVWDTTEGALDAAKEAAAKGDYETAIKKADRAKFESDSAYAQYLSQKDIKPWAF